jgi:FkbM family methyltransferase
MSLIFDFIDNLRFYNRRRIYRRLQSKPVRMSYNGFLFSGIQSFIDGTWEPGSTQVFKNLLDNVNLFVNVGAHHGYYCCIALNKGVKTIAFEPDKSNCLMIEKHIKANEFGDNFQLHEAAAGSKTSEMKFFGGGDTGSLIKPNPAAPLSQIDTVSVVKLDDLIEPKDQKIIFMIDTEGSELDVLKGSMNIISGNIKHYFIIELWDPDVSDTLDANEKHFSDVFKLMEAAGYTGWGIDEEKGELFEPTVNNLQVRKLPSDKACFSNYLFVHANENHDFLFNKQLNSALSK